MRMSLASITAKLVGQQYELGIQDCFALIIHYLRLQACPVPKEFHGYTMDTYKDLFLRRPAAAKILMVKLMAEILDEVPTHQAFAGDIMLLSLGEDKFLAINGGNSNIVAASKVRGVAVTPLKHYTIERVFRCRKLAHS